MFGLFKSESEKVVSKIYHMYRQVCSSGRLMATASTSKKHFFYFKLYSDAGFQLHDLFLKLSQIEDDEYCDAILKAVLKEDKTNEEVRKIIAEHYTLDMIDDSLHNFWKPHDQISWRK